MTNKIDLEEERSELLHKYWTQMKVDFFDENGFCPEFKRLCIDSDPEFGIRAIKNLYENK
jgi:hypothetical protein